MLTKLSVLETQASPRHPPPLGPFPRYIWIHQDTPQDSLDKACYEIWKRVQDLPDGLKSKSREEALPEPPACKCPTQGDSRGDSACGSHSKEEPVQQNAEDEISRLVEAEYLSLTKENLSEAEVKILHPNDGRNTTPDVYQSPLQSGLALPSPDQLADQKMAVEKMLKSIIGCKGREEKARPDCEPQFSAKPAAPSAARPAKCSLKSMMLADGSGGTSSASNKEITYLLAHFPLKHIESSKAPDNKMVMEETKIIKDFLKNSMFSSASGKKAALPLSLLPGRAAEGQAPGHKRQLPVFAKMCLKADAEPGGGGVLSIEENQSAREANKCSDDGGCQLSQIKKDAMCDESLGNVKQTNAFVCNNIKMSTWPDKNILYQCVGAPRNADGQPAGRSKAEAEGIGMKTTSSAASDKNNVKFCGHTFPARTSATSISAALNRPFLLNFPPPGHLPNHSNFSQFQGLYQQRARLPFPQTLHPQLGCYSRQISPYSHQQVAQQLLRSPYTPLMGYIPLVQPNYSFQQWNSQKSTGNTRDPPPMAGFTANGFDRG
ncbi:uncharacterized protein C1orf94 homolog isoform X2 [Rhinatrema bivittatum]|uniref:uncharacterized protein C1orf94 homolog isoform X2 n=1 Tax=Rhinatrema bivittatum TaxID=194408 RepID=UPI001127B48C|nr:uncharacterized protein C1orf94 homolog isoform X2 [Rhinatrema bivittatum]